MIKILDETTRYPLSKIGARAGICWGSDISNPEKNVKRGIDCIESGHHRLLEFVDIEMMISGYSARCIREWYTHIGGSPTRIQESTRYVDSTKFEYVLPKSIRDNEKALDIYREVMLEDRKRLKDLMDAGATKEDAAMILPLGMQTTIIDKRNLRNLIEMCHTRMCTRAYWEYRRLMYDIQEELRMLSPEWEWIVENYFKPKCEVYGYCTEKHSCGRKPKKEE